MQKQIQKFSKFAVRFGINILIIGLSVSLPAVAQTKKPNAKPETIYWYLDYVITVKGSGTEEGDASGSPTINWSIDRTYSGNLAMNERGVDFGTDPATLMNPQKIAAAIKAQRNIRYSYNNKTKEDALGHVRINDKLEIVREEACSDNSLETTTEVKIWRADAAYKKFPLMELTTDNSLLTYNVLFSILHSESINMSSQTVYQRTRGVKPKQPSAITETKARIPYLPNVAGLINNSIVRHAPAKPFPADFSTFWEFDSKDMSPDEPLIPGVADSKNVNIRVIYRFSKKPLY